MSKFTEANKKIEKAVVGTYEKIEDTVVGAYEAVEDAVVGAYKKVEDRFVETFLAEDGESAEQAKQRLAGKNDNNTEEK